MKRLLVDVERKWLKIEIILRERWTTRRFFFVRPTNIQNIKDVLFQNIFYITSVTRAAKNWICTCKNDSVTLCFEIIVALARFIFVSTSIGGDRVC